MSRGLQRPLQQRRIGGGYKRDDVDATVTDLRRQLDVALAELEAERKRAREAQDKVKGAEERAKKVEEEVAARPDRAEEVAQTLTAANRLSLELEERAKERAEDIEKRARERAEDVEAPARARAKTIIAEAEEQAKGIVAEGHAEADRASRELAELLRLREDVVMRMRAAIRDFAQAVGRVERGEAAMTGMPIPAAPPAHDAPSPAWDKAPDPLPAAPPASTEPAEAPAANESAEVVPAPASPGKRREEVKPRVDEHADARARVLAASGVIELDAGPLTDWGAVSAFETALRGLPSVSDVYIRRFADERAAIELRAPDTTSVAADLRSDLPYKAEVEPTGPGTLKVTLAAAG